MDFIMTFQSAMDHIYDEGSTKIILFSDIIAISVCISTFYDVHLMTKVPNGAFLRICSFCEMIHDYKLDTGQKNSNTEKFTV